MEFSNLKYSYIIYENKNIKDFPVFLKITTPDGIVLMHSIIIVFDTLEKAKQFCLSAIMFAAFNHMIIREEEAEK